RAESRRPVVLRPHGGRDVVPDHLPVQLTLARVHGERPLAQLRERLRGAVAGILLQRLSLPARGARDPEGPAPEREQGGRIARRAVGSVRHGDHWSSSGMLLYFHSPSRWNGISMTWASSVE